MPAVIKQNPSFIGEDGDQIDVTFYPARNFGQDRRRKQIVEVRKDNAIQSVWIDPKDVPDLIEALQQVHSQYLKFNGQSDVAAE